MSEFTTSSPILQPDDVSRLAGQGRPTGRTRTSGDGSGSLSVDLEALQADLDWSWSEVSEEDKASLDEYLRELELRKSALGLSSLHTSPFSTVSEVDTETGEVIEKVYVRVPVDGGPDESSYVPQLGPKNVQIREPKFVWYKGGSLVRVEREKVSAIDDSNDESPLFLKSPPVEQDAKEAIERLKRGGRRSTITTFSPGSRRRLMRTLARTEKVCLPLFVTLTYPDLFSEDFKGWKRDIDVFGKRLLRKWPNAGLVWRIEFKERLSGENEGKTAPHFHLLIWGVDYFSLREWISKAWYEVVGSEDINHLYAGTRVEHLRSWKGVMSYASKYIAKVDFEAMKSLEGVGRIWGIVGRANIPWAEELEQAIDERSAVKMMRWLRKYAGIKGRDYQTLTIFADGEQWKRCIEMLC